MEELRDRSRKNLFLRSDVSRVTEVSDICLPSSKFLMTSSSFTHLRVMFTCNQKSGESPITSYEGFFIKERLRTIHHLLSDWNSPVGVFYANKTLVVDCCGIYLAFRPDNSLLKRIIDSMCASTLLADLTKEHTPNREMCQWPSCVIWLMVEQKHCFLQCISPDKYVRRIGVVLVNSPISAQQSQKTYLWITLQ